MDYDVIIAGGSFAGLMAAAQLRGRRVLVIEPHEIGAVQTSACGTLLAVLEAVGAEDSLRQIHESIILHLPSRTIEYPLPYSFCTFDYRSLCAHLISLGDAEILRASVLGHQGRIVFTTRGAFDAEILIDATGWRAALAANKGEHAQANRGMNFGLETTIPVGGQGLHFFYEPDRLGMHNIGWLFPVGGVSRAGLGSYRGQARFHPSLEHFTTTYFQAGTNGRHGGYFPYHLQPPTTDHVFRVGDAAGQCFPFTGEGIRPAMVYGAVVGRLASRVLSGEMREPEALRTYQHLARRHTTAHRVLLGAQKVLPGLPAPWIERIASSIRRPRWLDLVLRAYWNACNPLELAAGLTSGRMSVDIMPATMSWSATQPQERAAEFELR